MTTENTATLDGTALDGWWAMRAYNTESAYGYGTYSEAHAWCDRQNASREINVYAPHFVGATDAEAEQATGMADIANYGMSLADELAAT